MSHVPRGTVGGNCSFQKCVLGCYDGNFCHRIWSRTKNVVESIFYSSDKHNIVVSNSEDPKGNLEKSYAVEDQDPQIKHNKVHNKSQGRNHIDMGSLHVQLCR